MIGASAFQRYAFDKRLNRNNRTPFRSLAQIADHNFKKGGFSISKIRRPERAVPAEWAKTNEGIQQVLLAAFPKLADNAKQRAGAGMWAQIIHQYYRMGRSDIEIAEYFGVERHIIKLKLQHIRNVADGKTSRGGRRKRDR